MGKMKFTKMIEDKENFVRKIIFEDETAITETVLYNYDNRAVICFSTQSGCPVGCVFCGTGNKFIRNLTYYEMEEQIEKALSILKAEQKPKRIQIMAMSMGEPMLNWTNVSLIAEAYLNKGYSFFISTIGINDVFILNDFARIGRWHKKFGVQFSLHECNDGPRLRLFRNKNLSYMPIRDMLGFGAYFQKETGNKAYYNYIAKGDETDEELRWLAEVMKNNHLTCSVKCNTKKTEKSDPYLAIDIANKISELSGYEAEVSVFNPAGQDTIGGGCGQLLYVQEKMKNFGTSEKFNKV